MKFSFKAKIYKVGINPCVRVPFRVTRLLTATKGFIPVKGTIDAFPFQQTLCPVKNSNYRLYVNGIMLKGAQKTTGDSAVFLIQQDDKPKTTAPPMLPQFKKRLAQEKLMTAYHALTLSQQKEILKYMDQLKGEESRRRSIEKVISQLRPS